MQDRQPAGQSNGTGGRWMPSPPKAKGDLPLLSYELLEGSPVLSEARDLLRATSVPYSLDVIPISSDGVVVHGSILVHQWCSSCDTFLDTGSIHEMIGGDEHTITCHECGASVEIISVRNKVGSSAEEIFNAINEVTALLKNDFCMGRTALEEKQAAVRRLKDT